MTNAIGSRKRTRGRIALAVAGAAATALTWSWVYAAHEHGKDGDKGKQEEKSSGGGHAGHGGQEGKEKGQGHGMHHALPGAVEQMCHGEGGHPPHYCEPAYKAASSAPGVRVDDVDPTGEREVQVKLRELNAQAPGVAQKLVVVAGTGDLAGAAVVDAGWKQEKTVNVKLNGTGSIYAQRHLHLHVFPLTAP